MSTPRGYSGSSRITRPRVTQVRARLVADSASHKRKQEDILDKDQTEKVVKKLEDEWSPLQEGIQV